MRKSGEKRGERCGEAEEDAEEETVQAKDPCPGWNL